MNRASGLRILVLLAVSAALMITTETAFAQHGGHGGGGGGGFGGHGGGFGGHGGGFGGHGGGFGGHGGGFGGHGGGFGSHGGGFGGFHHGGGFHNGGGFRGFHNRYGGFGGWGYSRYGYDFDFDFFPFFSYWGGYPYWGAYPYFGYSPWWWGVPSPYYAPYPYDYDYGPSDRDYYRYRRNEPCRPDYRYDDRCRDNSPDNSAPNRERGPAWPSNGTYPESSPGHGYVTHNVEDYRESIHTNTPATAEASNFHLASSSALDAPSQLRPVVRNAIAALRAMPPQARERLLGSDRYQSFSAEERELLKQTFASSVSE